jgi:MFS family permease
MRPFIVVWLGQLFSIIGSGLTGFVLGVWVYQQTGSATAFALNQLAFALPHVLVLTMAGVLVDRWDRRHLLLLCDATAALTTLGLAVLLYSGRLEVWHTYLVNAAWGVIAALQVPALLAATPALVPRRHLMRAAGLSRSAIALGLLASPLLAGVLLPVIGLVGVVLVDFASYFFALSALLLVRIPRPARVAEHQAPAPLWRSALEGWHYVAAQPGFRGILGYLAVVNLALHMARVLALPMVLTFTSPQTLAWMVSVGVGGMIAGGLSLALCPIPPQRRMTGLLLGGLLGGLGLVTMGLRPSPVLVAIGMFGAYFSLPVIDSCVDVIWQTRTPAWVHGRVSASFRLAGAISAPVAYASAGPLADRVFEPMLAAGGRLAAALGPGFGSGPGRGTGLMYVLLGLGAGVAVIVTYLSPAVRRIEAPEAEPPQPNGRAVFASPTLRSTP